uniref:peptide ABC transporter substrate-binding protein n=1 Tax=Sphingomonas bacterium TaxID=1895847 RepID=UPI0026209367|nr:peptide ABC transporter substrate-binding protein [Sphingomonas bacterium]
MQSGFFRLAIQVAMGAVLLAGCGARDRAPHRGLVRLSDDEVKGLDPQKISDLTSLRVAEDQFEGLTRHRGDGRAELALASSVRCSADKLICRFALRPGLHFSDGTAITAATFAQGFARLRDPKTTAPNAKLFEGIAGIAAQGPATVIVTLHRPLPWLAELLAQPALAALPMHRIAAVGDRWTSDRPLVTSGAYRLTGWRLGDRLTLSRNPAWHDPPAPTATIIWQAAEDKLAALRRFRGQEADTVSDIPPARLEWARAHLPGAVRVAPYAGTYYLAFNTRKPPFDDVRIRRALSMAVDRNWIATRLMGSGETGALALVPPVLGGRDPDVFATPDRPTTIRRLLTAAGYGPARPLIFDVRFNSGGDHRRIAVALAAMWKPYGVEARLLNSEATLHFAALRLGDFQLARSGWIADVPRPENFLSVHLSGAGAVNYSGFADPDFDRLVARALDTADPNARTALLEAAEQRLLRAAPILPIYHYVSRSLVAPDVRGWQDNAMNIHPSRLLYRVPR